METHKSVMLPEHLWRALDDMSKDGAQHADLLVRLAVEQFVALQGYDVPPAQRVRPAAAPPQPAPEPALQAAPAPAPAAAAKPLPPAPAAAPAPAAKRAPKAAVPATAPAAKLRPAASPPSPNPTPAAPPPQMDDDDNGEAMTRVRQPSGQAPAMAGSPAVTDASPAHKPQATVTEPPTMGGPEWLKRGALVDADSDRTAARERMLAIDNEIAKLTLERPTTAPLSEAAADDAEDDEADPEAAGPE